MIVLRAEFVCALMAPQYRAQYSEPDFDIAREKMPPPCAAERRGKRRAFFTHVEMYPHPTGRRGCFFFAAQYVVTPVKASSALPVRRTPSSS